MIKLIFFITTALWSVTSIAQDNEALINAQFERLKGDWEGYMEYNEVGMGNSRFSMPAKCSSKFDGKRWVYDVQYDEGGGEVVIGGGDCKVMDGGLRMDYNGIVWDVASVTTLGDSVKIVMTTVGKENRKKIEIRQTLECSTLNFSILEEAKEPGSDAYVFRQRHLFKRKK